MIIKIKNKCQLCFVALIVLVFFSFGYSQITVVNMVPNWASDEEEQDSEPNIAVNYNNPTEIAASAFTPNPFGGSQAPVYVSTDGGLTWDHNYIVPSTAGSWSGTKDITLHFGLTSDTLYSGILHASGSYHLNILRTEDFLGTVPMTVLVDRYNVDQPYAMATTVMGGGFWGQDMIYVGNNDFAALPASATVDLSTDGAAVTPVFLTERIDQRTPFGQDGPPIRVAMHGNGTVYAVFSHRTASSGSYRTGNIVVVRDDNWASGATPFSDLIDPGDGIAGVRVITGVTFPFASPWLSQERVGDRLSVAVDPRNSATVYVSWTDTTDSGPSDNVLHVRRSTDSGVTWSSDLYTVSEALSPTLAINTHGRVAFSYQQLTGTSPSQRWVTLLTRTDDAFTTVDMDTLATVPAGTPVRSFYPYLGDYMDLMAVGQNFYGVFSTSNTPDMDRFPQGVTYHRNVNWATSQLLDLTSNPVNESIDPFFYKVTELPDSLDFYVRDWTASTTSADPGLEPSTHPVFYATSDVWNSRSTTSGGFNANDQPISEDPQTSAFGHNYAWARVHRKALGAAETVTLHFLKSEFGCGSNYQDANTTADPTLAFGPTDLALTMTTGYQWDLMATTSTHVCLAVEISSPNDPFIAPSVLGSAPGWPTTDLRFIWDNNKAQRNMGVYDASEGGSAAFFGVLHNADLRIRDMEIKYHIEPRVRELLGDIDIKIVGDSEEFIHRKNTIILPEMKPGENRWLALTVKVPETAKKKILPIRFEEVVDNLPVNGFAIGVVPDGTNRMIHSNLSMNAAVFMRMGKAYALDEAVFLAKNGMEMNQDERVNEAEYTNFVRSNARLMKQLVSKVMELEGVGDKFGVLDEISRLTKNEDVPRTDTPVSVHACLLHRLDAFMTYMQKRHGDTADILQNVKWQESLYKQIRRLSRMDPAKDIVNKSHNFIKRYQARKIDNKAYPGFVGNLIPQYKKTADILNNIELRRAVSGMSRNLDSLQGLQKAHREFLLILESYR